MILILLFIPITIVYVLIAFPLALYKASKERGNDY